MRSRRGTSWRLLTAAVLSIAVAVAGCGDPDQKVGGEAESNGSKSGHPFWVDGVPSRFKLRVAGRGATVQDWASDVGSDEPYTVINADGRVVLASVVPWEPMDSDLRSASASGDPDSKTFELSDGRKAAYGQGASAGQAGGAWSDLVIEVGPTEAIRLASAGATRAELVDLAPHVTSDGNRAKAPLVKDLPKGYELVGSVNSDALIALRARLYPIIRTAPGPESAYGVGWSDTETKQSGASMGSLAVMVLPGESFDLDALAVDLTGSSSAKPRKRTEVTVDGRPGLYLSGGWRSVATTTASGAGLIVTSYSGKQPAKAEMIRIASSVGSISDKDWKKRQVEAFGGPGLHPDDGEVEIARGDENGIEWLLQTYTYPLKPRDVGPTAPDYVGPRGDASITPAPCLKLSTMKWACANSQGGGQNGSFDVWNSSSPNFGEVGLPPFAVVTTPLTNAVSVRMTVGESTSEAKLSEVPGGNPDKARVAIVFGELPAGSVIPACVAVIPPTPEGISVARVELLDVSGASVGCLGV